MGPRRNTVERVLVAALAAVGVLAGCTPPPGPRLAPSAPAVPAVATPPPQAVDPDAGRAPTPYSAQQLREASQEGRSYEHLVERPAARPIRRRLVFLAVSDERATISESETDADGKAAPGGGLVDATWEQLRLHASFPKEATTIVEDQSETPVGVFACLRYTVQEQTAEGLVTKTLWFAKELPGPPVETWLQLDGQTVERTALLKYQPGLP